MSAPVFLMSAFNAPTTSSFVVLQHQTTGTTGVNIIPTTTALKITTALATLFAIENKHWKCIKEHIDDTYLRYRASGTSAYVHTHEDLTSLLRTTSRTAQPIIVFDKDLDTTWMTDPFLGYDPTEMLRKNDDRRSDAQHRTCNRLSRSL